MKKEILNCIENSEFYELIELPSYIMPTMNKTYEYILAYLRWTGKVINVIYLAKVSLTNSSWFRNPGRDMLRTT